MILALDFDRTLFDSDAYHRAISEKGLAHLVCTPELLTKLNPQPFLFSDVHSFLTSHTRNTLYIVSAITPEYGPQAGEYQLEKIRATGMFELVQDVMLVIGSKKPCLAQIVEKHPSESVWFVDDTEEHLREAHECSPMVRPFRIVRGGTIPDREGDISTIHQLSDLTHYA